jgi:two-component sensor histidine kinase/PAS domain-containing protein
MLEAVSEPQARPMVGLGFPATSGDLLLTAQKQALEMVVRGAPLHDVLAFLTSIVEQHSDGEVVASILLLDRSGCLRIGAAPSLPDDYNQAIDGLKARADLGTCSVAAVTGEVVITEDIEADHKWATIKHLPLGLGLKSAWSQPIVAGDGAVLGTFGTYFRQCRGPSLIERQLLEVLSQTAALAIERARAEEGEDQQRRVLDGALDAAEMGIWRLTFADRVCRLSPRAQSLYALPSAEWTYREDSVDEFLHPDDILARTQSLQAACDPNGTGRYATEYRVRDKDGWRWLSVWGIVEFEQHGAKRHPVRMVGASRDITAQKDAEHRQKILIDELNHRVKNTLAIIQSIARQTLRHSPDPEEFNEAFSARLAALARAHTLLTLARRQDVSLTELVTSAVEPFSGTGNGSVYSIDGPAVNVKSDATMMLALLLHELATNAAKYGALSAPEGRVAINWVRRASGPDAEHQLEITWQESGGPPVKPPDREGLGSKLMNASVQQLGGDIAMDFQEAGLRCTFSISLER